LFLFADFFVSFFLLSLYSTELVYQDGSQVQPMEEGTRQDEVEVEEKEAEEASKKAQEDEAEIQVNAWMK
jgi:translation elongation factor P/translation initiation factor 5A